MIILSIILFDCTQLVSFNLVNDSVDTKYLVSNFKQHGFNVILGSEIQKKKTDYLRDYLLDNTVEIIDNEFIGEFEEWDEKDIVPNRIQKFISLINNIFDCQDVIGLKIFLIEHASEEKGEDRVVYKEIDNSSLSNGLFLASKRCFDAWGNIYCFEIKR